MPGTPPSNTTPPAPFAQWAADPRALWALVGGVTLVRLALIAWVIRIPLLEDEAHYWEWSRRLEPAYYSKGPGIAWLIRASTELLGVSEFSVRLPAVLCGAVTLLAIAALAGGVFKDRRAGFFAAACALCTPIVQGIGLLSTIDAPFAACWSVALWAAWRCVSAGHERRRWCYTALFAALGAGMLFKYTSLLLAPGFLGAAWLLRAPPRRGHLPGLALGVLLFAACAAPIVAWNAREGWPTASHLLGNMGLPGGDMPASQFLSEWTFRVKWPLEMIGSQAALVGPVIVLMIVGARRGAPGAVFFRCTAGAVLLFYGAMSLVGPVKGNWPLAAWLSLAPGAGWCVVEAMTRWRGLVRAWRDLPRPRPRAGWFRKQPETVLQVAWTASWVGGVLIAAAIPLLPALSRAPVVGALVPMGRMTGPPEIARGIVAHAEQLARDTGREPFVITTHWGIAGQLAFYLPGRPTVYCATSRMTGGRRTQYDYWAQTDLTRVHASLAGRPAVILGKPAVFWAPAFKGVRPLGAAPGDVRRDRWLAYGYGFVGFGDEANIRGWFDRLHPRTSSAGARAGY